MLEAFIAGIDRCEDEEARRILNLVCDLYALNVIETDKAFFPNIGCCRPNGARAVTNGSTNAAAICARMPKPWSTPSEFPSSAQGCGDAASRTTAEAWDVTPPVSIAEQIIDWLFHDQLGSTRNGPISRRPASPWWADRYA